MVFLPLTPLHITSSHTTHMLCTHSFFYCHSTHSHTCTHATHPSHSYTNTKGLEKHHLHIAHHSGLSCSTPSASELCLLASQHIGGAGVPVGVEPSPASLEAD